MPPLELPGVKVIEHPHEARAHARGWSRMARELDTPDAPPAAKEKARELRQRAQAAHAWARQQEDALSVGQRAHDEHAKRESNVSPIRGGTAGEQYGPIVKKRESEARQGFVSGAARAAGNRAYRAARPPAMRIAHNGRQHFFQGLEEPFGPAGDAWETLLYALGATLGVVLLADLIRAPKAIAEASSHGLGFLHRATSLSDPFTGLSATAPRAAAGSARPAAPHPGSN